jgi:hypothetical protein
MMTDTLPKKSPKPTELKSIKIPQDSYEQLKILKTVTGEKYLTLLDQAVNLLTEAYVSEYPQLQALLTYLNEPENPNQMSIDAYL